MSKAKEQADFLKVAKIISAQTHTAYTKMLQGLADGGALKPATKRAVANFMDCLNGSTITLDFESNLHKRPASASFKSRITTPETSTRVSVEIIINGSARF
jgi:hypothetical protein